MRFIVSVLYALLFVPMSTGQERERAELMRRIEAEHDVADQPLGLLLKVAREHPNDVEKEALRLVGKLLVDGKKLDADVGRFLLDLSSSHWAHALELTEKERMKEAFLLVRLCEDRASKKQRRQAMQDRSPLNFRDTFTADVLQGNVYAALGELQQALAAYSEGLAGAKDDHAYWKLWKVTDKMEDAAIAIDDIEKKITLLKAKLAKEKK
jgi:tetratricopeptide (TPR) repeat protein